eukprot:9276248-Alexandrium_andersonii.AAC.1
MGDREVRWAPRSSGGSVAQAPVSTPTAFPRTRPPPGVPPDPSESMEGAGPQRRVARPREGRGGA